MPPKGPLPLTQHRATVATASLTLNTTLSGAGVWHFRAGLNEGRETDERKTETERGVLIQGMKEKCD